MVKIRIHIHTPDLCCDENVYVDINLPSVPRINEVVFLDDELFLELENKAKVNLEVARFYTEYLYGASLEVEMEDLQQKNLKDLGFEDAHYVYNVVYNSNSDIIKIELAMNPKTYNDE